MDLDLTGKHAVVCGASQGIGRATAEALAALGANITLIARNAATLESARAALPAVKAQRHHCLVADFDRPAELNRMLAGSLPALGAVHILVNNSGGPPGGPAHGATLDEYRTAFERHLMCNQVLLQAVLPTMRKAGYGRIVNIISTSVREPIKGLGVSNSIRGAVAAWAKTLSMELGADGITVNNVLPGFTRTQRLEAVFIARMEKFNMSRAAVEADALSEVPLGRFAEASEVADAVAFLCSPAAAYISGISLAVDGGRMRSI